MNRIKVYGSKSLRGSSCSCLECGNPVISRVSVIIPGIRCTDRQAVFATCPECAKRLSQELLAAAWKEEG